MRAARPSQILTVGALVATLCGAGCGNSSPSSTASTASAPTTSSTTTTSSASTAGNFSVIIPALKQDRSKAEDSKLMPARYKCHAGSSWPSLHWKNVPADTTELALFFIHEGKKGTPVDWAVAGLKPELPGISAGVLPPGAIVGSNRLHRQSYSVCPPKGRPSEYAVALYALDHQLAAKPGFAADALLTKVEQRPHGVALLGFH
jgi:phosphatidylethanolamine-binding protein (PEBP) family uncharacterized protein